MKQVRHIALIAALIISCAANDASAQAISNVPDPAANRCRQCAGNV